MQFSVLSQKQDLCKEIFKVKEICPGGVCCNFSDLILAGKVKKICSKASTIASPAVAN